jgi:hypothetical protein
MQDSETSNLPPIGEELENKPDDGSQKTIIQIHDSLFVSVQVPGTFGGIAKRRAPLYSRHVPWTWTA